MKIPVSVFVVSADEMVCKRLQSVFSQNAEFNLVGDAKDHHAAADLLLRLQPDVIVWDLQLETLIESEAWMTFCRTNPKSRVLALCHANDEHLMGEVLRRGAWGYKIKDDKNLDEIVEAIRTIHHGGAVIGAKIGGQILNELGPAPLNRNQSAPPK